MTKKSPDRNEQRTNSSSERLLHHTDLTIVTQTTMMMLFKALLIQQKKASAQQQWQSKDLTSPVLLWVNGAFIPSFKRLFRVVYEWNVYTAY